ncbi:MAG: hypothetical protein PHS14_01120 [Elusimicrobia bacterium]|nr:hypothetical protein [Elusimicrobiota bacterium]
MKLSRLALAAALAAVWAALPLAARAQDGGKDGDEETIEVRKRMHHDGGEEARGDRDGGPRERREGMVGREPGEGPRGPRDMDPEMKEKFEKTRELELKTREISKVLRQGSDSEKAAAKADLRKTLGELFDAKLAMETAMLAKMEKHVAELRAKIAKKKSSREKAIESRFVRMSGEGDDWD